MSRERGVSEATSESIRESDARLLDAAARLFRERGYAKASLRRIAQAADMLPGSIHYRYPTKLDLYLAVARRAVVAHRAPRGGKVADSVLRNFKERIDLDPSQTRQAGRALWGWQTVSPGSARSIRPTCAKRM